MVLSVNNLTGFNSGGGVFTYSFVETVTPSVVDPVATATGASIGTAAGNRSILVGYTSDFPSAGGNVYSATIGGSSMTSVTQFEDDNPGYVGFFILPYPTGTTATIVITGSLGMPAQTKFHIWAIYSLSNLTPSNIQNFDVDGGVNPDFDVPIISGNNATFAVRMTPSAQTFTWTGLTERSDETGATSGHSAADAYNSIGSTLNVTCSGTGNGGLSCIHFSQ